MASGNLIAGYYNGVYLQLNWEAVANRQTQKYTVNWNVKKYGDGAGYYTWIHYLRVYFDGNRFESTDVAKQAYDGDVIASGSFEIGAGNFTVELHGGIYTYVENVSNSTNVTLDTVVPLYPTVKVEKVSTTATTISVKASVTNGVSSSKYKFVCNGETKETSSNQVTFENLTPNKAYIIKCYGYANGRYGDEASITITTNSQSTISDIGDFTLDGVRLVISGKSGDTSTLQVIVNNQVIVTRENIGVGEYNLVLTQEEKDTIYQLIGTNNSIDAILRIETGGAFIDYNTRITLTGDVFSCYIKENGVLKRGKVWVGTGTGNKQGILTIGTNSGNVRGR